MADAAYELLFASKHLIDREYSLPGQKETRNCVVAGNVCYSAEDSSRLCALMLCLGGSDASSAPKSMFGLLPASLQREILRHLCPVHVDSLLLGPHNSSDIFMEQERKIARCKFGPSIVFSGPRITHPGRTLIADFEVAGGLCWSVGVLPSDVQNSNALWPGVDDSPSVLQTEVTGFVNDGVNCSLPRLNCDTASKRGRFTAILEVPEPGSPIPPSFTVIQHDKKVAKSAPLCPSLICWFREEQKRPERDRYADPQGLCIAFSLFKGVVIGLRTNPDHEFTAFPEPLLY